MSNCRLTGVNYSISFKGSAFLRYVFQNQNNVSQLFNILGKQLAVITKMILQLSRIITRVNKVALNNTIIILKAHK